MGKQVFIVCPNDSCNSLYSLEDIFRGGSLMRCTSKCLAKSVGVNYAIKSICRLVEERFRIQQLVDKGDGDKSKWPMIFMHPKRSNVL